MLYTNQLKIYKLYKLFSFLQPDVNDIESNEDDQNLESIDAIVSKTPILNRPSKKPTKLQRRRTIDTVQARQYSSERQHRTAFQHIQAMFWPLREKMKPSTDREHEQMPMVSEKRKTNLRRTSSVHDDEQTITKTTSSGRRRRHRIQRRSDTVAIV